MFLVGIVASLSTVEFFGYIFTPKYEHLVDELLKLYQNVFIGNNNLVRMNSNSKSLKFA